MDNDNDNDMVWVRTCQECGRIQGDNKPQGHMTDAYANRKCRQCQSMSLDYGRYTRS